VARFERNQQFQPGEENADLFEHFRFEVDPGQGLLRIDKYLWHKIENASRNRIQQAARVGNILVNNLPVKQNYRVKPEDVITLVLPHPPRILEIIAENLPIDILYEDLQIIVINKAAGMVVHPGVGNLNGTLLNALKYHLLFASRHKDDESEPILVHRIDKDTSGLLVVAKNEMTQATLAREFFEHTIERKYVALVWGNLKDDAGTIRGNIGRHPKDRTVMTVFPEEDEHGKHAVTHYRVIERFRYVTLVECQLETGRTHQIRAHFKHIGHPLFSDADYGGDKILKGTTFSKYKQFVQNCFELCPRQALHAQSLGFIHPSTLKPIHFESPLPADLTALLHKWREYTSHNQES